MHKIKKIFFILGLFFIPFNSFENVDILGEYRSESAIYFFLIGLLFVGIEFLIRKKIPLPLKNFLYQIFLIYFIWCICSVFINHSTVVDNYFKYTTGYNRALRQIGSLFISSILLVAFFWACVKDMDVKEMLKTIRTAFLASLLFNTVYCFFEVLIVVFNIEQVRPIIELFSYFPFLEVKVFGDRISGVSYESPFLAIYLITVAGWMFSYILTSQRNLLKYIPTLIVLLLTFFSGSRTGLFVVTIQFLLFLFILALHKKKLKVALRFVGGFLFLIFVIVVLNPKGITQSIAKKIDSLNFKENLTENVSNKSRIGIQFASMEVFKRNPIAGVGYGQQTYHNRLHYPKWATNNNYEFTLFYKDQRLKSFPPGYNLYVRTLAETGMIGFLIFGFFILAIFYALLKLYRNTNNQEKHLTVILTISFVGLLINFLQIDTLRIYGFWIYLCVLIRLIGIYNQRKTLSNSESDLKYLGE